VTAPDLARAIEQLNNADAKVRLAGISALSAMGESAKEATPQLILLLKDSSPTVRSIAASALGIVGVEVAGTAAQLEQTMKDDPNPEVRKAASEALEYLYYIDHERIRGL
jgi:HEAT repeat protein